MFDIIRQHQDLSGLIRHCCEENGIGADFDTDLKDHAGDPDDEKVIILKIDQYYNQQNIAARPKSIDFLILVRCCNPESHSLYLIELKNTSDRVQLAPAGIIEKFKTTVSDFINDKFNNVFSNSDYKRIKLFLISQKTILAPAKNKNRSSQFDAFSTTKPFELLGHKVMIEPMPPNPIITPC